MKSILFEQSDSDCSLLCHSDYEPLVYNSEGKTLSLILSIPISSIKDILSEQGFKNIEENLDKTIYVFSYYDTDDYFLDSLTYHGTDEEYQFIKDTKSTQVIITEDTFNHSHQASSQTLNQASYAIKLSNMNASEPESDSYFGGCPRFLQNERYQHLEEHIFLCQINGFDIPDDMPDIFYLKGANGYLFLSKTLDDGIFFIQTT